MCMKWKHVFVLQNNPAFRWNNFETKHCSIMFSVTYMMAGIVFWIMMSRIFDVVVLESVNNFIWTSKSTAILYDQHWVLRRSCIITKSMFLFVILREFVSGILCCNNLKILLKSLYTVLEWPIATKAVHSMCDMSLHDFHKLYFFLFLQPAMMLRAEFPQMLIDDWFAELSTANSWVYKVVNICVVNIVWCI